ncbi:atrial natriuretic peptide receptor 1-like [Octopus vulgaris]|uniref:guanylate cyclase n=1 Tax=Octopus vulgaris TaxID=6645 RepID=A0AA36B2I5_OCTVU|nr:atrial natriuretic peptide receptor 1-like [Octopus vulgaris]
MDSSMSFWSIVIALNWFFHGTLSITTVLPTVNTNNTNNTNNTDTSSDIIEIKVGVLGLDYEGYPFSIPRIGPAIEQGIERVNNDMLNSSFKLTPVIKVYGHYCATSKAPGMAAELFYHDKIVAFLGPACTYAVEPTSLMASYWNIPLITVILLIVPGETKRKFLLEAYNMGYIDGQYVFIDIVMFLFDGEYVGNHDWKRMDGQDIIAKKAFEALLRVSLYIQYGEKWDEFEKNVKEVAQRKYNFTFGEEKANYLIGTFYDSAILYGYALNETLESGGNIRNSTDVTRRMWNRNFTGITGEVVIDDNGDRESSFSILDMNPITGKFQVVGHYLANKPYYEPVPDVKIHWPGNLLEPPPNEPRCGFLGDDPACIKRQGIPIYVYILLAVFGIGLLLMIVGFIVNRRNQEKKNMEAMGWRIDLSEIKFGTTKLRSGASVNFCGSQISAQSSKSKIASIVSENQIFIQTAIYKGAPVAVKRLPFPDVVLSKPLIRELNEIRRTHHQNLVHFIGACIEKGAVLILNEYCNKGSLHDLFANETVTLDQDLRISFIKDLVKGMIFLHDSDIKSHGRLTSSNCVIDGRFVLKVSDYGLGQLYKQNIYPPKFSEEYKKLLWRAPEHLRSTMPVRGSQKGDVYSVGIIMQEILYECLPFESESSTLTEEEIVSRVEAGLKPPFRPTLETPSEFFCELIQKCWRENPDDRPDLKIILNIIKSKNKGKDKDIMETLLGRMEMYASNLQSLVDERTVQLETERKKLETLLHQILPSSIANQLKLGKPVEPESFDCVSVFFSDIVGYTDLSFSSTPLEITTLLNDLYSAFDSVLENFDVYKVETIGDAYMVASGLPIRNGKKHAGEIGRMSLQLLQKVSTFVVKHRPKEVLKLRIGIHSGPCVAGVVGVKMPRYCLIGDTVNTASRMESTGEALKIHCSAMTKQLLDEIGGFFIELRGDIDVKGKGIMKTYWLKGEQDVNTEKPDPYCLTPPSE